MFSPSIPNGAFRLFTQIVCAAKRLTLMVIVSFAPLSVLDLAAPPCQVHGDLLCPVLVHLLPGTRGPVRHAHPLHGGAALVRGRPHHRHLQHRGGHRAHQAAGGHVAQELQADRRKSSGISFVVLERSLYTPELSGVSEKRRRLLRNGIGPKWRFRKTETPFWSNAIS